MNLLKHILLGLLICLTSACSGSKMEPIGEDPFLNGSEEIEGELTLDDDGELTLDQDKTDERLSLAPDIPEPPARPPAPRPSVHRPSVHRPSQPPVLDSRPTPQAGCPNCPLAPTVVDRPPCHPTCPQPPPAVVTPPCHPICPSPSDCNADIVTSSPTSYAGTKIVFVVDKGSHNYIPTDNADGGNDPQKLTRVHHIHQFVEGHRDRGFSWSMITFYGRERGWRGFARAYISRDEGGRQPIFTEDYNVISQAIEDLSTRPDGPRRENRDHGKIQYGDALQLAEKLIEEDIERQGYHDAYYLVFFIAGESPRGHQERYPFEDYIYRKVEDIVNIKPGRVFFSTAYYGWNHLLEHTYGDGSENPNVPNVTGILQYMASLGNGQFFHLENIARRYNAQATPCDLASPCDVHDTYYDDASDALSLPNSYQGNSAHVFSSPCSASNLSPEPVEMVRSSVLPCGHTEEEHDQILFCPYSSR